MKKFVIFGLIAIPLLSAITDDSSFVVGLIVGIAISLFVVLIFWGLDLLLNWYAKSDKHKKIE